MDIIRLSNEIPWASTGQVMICLALEKKRKSCNLSWTLAVRNVDSPSASGWRFLHVPVLQDPGMAAVGPASSRPLWAAAALQDPCLP